jgi:hypothetical protein
MPPQPSHTTIIMGILLAGAWTVLAYGLGAILPGLPGALDPASASPTERHSGSISVQASGTNPCTGESINIEAWLTINVIQEGEAGETNADAEVRLESFQGAPPIEGIDPVIRHFSIFKTPLTSTQFVHTVRTSLAGRLSFHELVVDLVGGVTDRGAVSLSLSSARIETLPLPCRGRGAAIPA